MVELNKWEKQVVKEILCQIDFLITEVNSFEIIKSLFFDKANLHKYLFLIPLKYYKLLNKFCSFIKKIK